MSTSTKTIIGVASVAAISTILILRFNRKKNKRRREQAERISDEGYEFAGDILYPLKRYRKRLY